jgi:Tfp pilus assembly protein PilF
MEKVPLLTAVALGLILAFCPSLVCGQVQEDQAREKVANQDPKKLKELDRLWGAAEESFDNDEFSQAAEYGEKIFALEKALFGEQDPELISTLDWLADIYQRQDAWKKAIDRSESALRLSHKIHGKEDWRTVDAQLVVKDLKLRSKLTQDQRDELARADQLGQQSAKQDRAGNFAAALKSAKSESAIRKKVLGEEHPSYTNSLNNLAMLYESMGHYARAEPLFLKCRDIDKKVSGEEHPNFASTLNNLALLYLRMGEYARAKPLILQCLDIRKKVLGEDHPSYATTLNNLAGLYESGLSTCC